MYVDLQECCEPSTAAEWVSVRKMDPPAHVRLGTQGPSRERVYADVDTIAVAIQEDRISRIQKPIVWYGDWTRTEVGAPDIPENQ